MKITNILLTASLMASPIMANRSTSGSFNVGVGGSIDFSKAKVTVKRRVPDELERLRELLEASCKVVEKEEAPEKLTEEEEEQAQTVPDDAHDQESSANNRPNTPKTKEELWRDTEGGKMASSLCDIFSKIITVSLLTDDMQIGNIAAEADNVANCVNGSPAAIAQKIKSNDKLIGEFFRIISEEVQSVKTAPWFKSALQKNFGKNSDQECLTELSNTLKPIVEEIIRSGHGHRLLSLFAKQNDGSYNCKMWLGDATNVGMIGAGGLSGVDMVDFCHKNVSEYNCGLLAINHPNATKAQLHDELWKGSGVNNFVDKFSDSLATAMANEYFDGGDYNWWNNNAPGDQDVEKGSWAARAVSSYMQSRKLGDFLRALINIEPGLKNEAWFKSEVKENLGKSTLVEGKKELAAKLKQVLEKIFKAGKGERIISLFEKENDGHYLFKFDDNLAAKVDIDPTFNNIDSLVNGYKNDFAKLQSLTIQEPSQQPSGNSQQSRKNTTKGSSLSKLNGDDVVAKLCRLYSKSLADNVLHDSDIVDAITDPDLGVAHGCAPGSPACLAALSGVYGSTDQGMAELFNVLSEECSEIKKEKWFNEPLKQNFGKTNPSEAADELTAKLKPYFEKIFKSGKGARILSIYEKKNNGSYFFDPFGGIDVTFSNNSDEAKILDAAHSFVEKYSGSKKSSKSVVKNRSKSVVKQNEDLEDFQEYFDPSSERASGSKRATSMSLFASVGYEWLVNDKWLFDADANFSVNFGGKAKIHDMTVVCNNSYEKFSSKDTLFSISRPWTCGLTGGAGFLIHPRFALFLVGGLELCNIKLNTHDYRKNQADYDDDYNVMAVRVNKNLPEDKKIKLINFADDVKQNISKIKIGGIFGLKGKFFLTPKDAFSLAFLITTASKINDKKSGIAAKLSSFRIQFAYCRKLGD